MSLHAFRRCKFRDEFYKFQGIRKGQKFHGFGSKEPWHRPGLSHMMQPSQSEIEFVAMLL